MKQFLRICKLQKYNYFTVTIMYLIYGHLLDIHYIPLHTMLKGKKTINVDYEYLCNNFLNVCKNNY